MVVVVAEDVARSTQFADILDELMRSPSFDKMLTLKIARGAPAREVLATLPPQETLPALFIDRFVNKKDGHDRSRITRLWEVWRLMHTPGAEISVGGIAAGTTELDISGTAVFKNSQMVGWLGPYETRGAEFIRDDIFLASLTMSADAEHAGYELIEKLAGSRRITAHLEETHVRFTIELGLEGWLRTKPAETQRIDAQQIALLQSAAAKGVESEVRAALEHLVALNADILELGAMIRRRYPTEWRERIDWDEWFPRSQFEIDVQVKLRRIGPVI